MKKKILLIVALVAIIIIGAVIFLNQKEDEPIVIKEDHLNTTYRINGVEVKLVDGYHEEDIVDSSAKVITRYFGNEVVADLNEDGLEDIAFLITQDTGGSGTFYYLVAALKNEESYVGSNAYFIGDRIAPQTTNYLGNGVVVVNYADRAEDEPMATTPSIGKSLYLKLDLNNNWITVEE